MALNAEVGDRSSEAQCSLGLARLAHCEGHMPDALRRYRQALDILSETVERQTVAMALLRIAETMEAMGRTQEALALANASDGIYADMGCIRPPILEPCHAELRKRLSGVTGAAVPGEQSLAANPEYNDVVSYALRVVSEAAPSP